MVAKSKKNKSQASTPLKKSELLFKVGKDLPKWYSIETPSSTSSKSNEKYDKQKCEQIYRAECDLYQSLYQQDQSSDYQWLQTSLSTTSKVWKLTREENLTSVFVGSSCSFSYTDSSFACSCRRRTRQLSKIITHEYCPASWRVNYRWGSWRCFP